jgi:hypothetical protein
VDHVQVKQQVAAVDEALDLIREKLEPTYRVMVVPELATITILGGYNMATHKQLEDVVYFTVNAT